MFGQLTNANNGVLALKQKADLVIERIIQHCSFGSHDKIMMIEKLKKIIESGPKAPNHRECVEIINTLYHYVKDLPDDHICTNSDDKYYCIDCSDDFKSIFPKNF